MPTWDNIISRKRQVPKRVELTDSRTFLARYEQVKRDHLPANIRMRQHYRQRAAPKGRCRCRGRCRRELGSLFRLAINLVKSLVVRSLGKIALKELTGSYSKGTKNK